MSRWFEAVHDLQSDLDVLRRRRYGVIEVCDEQLVGIWLRPWPKVISLPEISFLGRGFHQRRPGNHSWLYYNQPRQHSNYLVLKYVLSARDTTLNTFRGALTILDEIARMKRSDALLCDASNMRISDRLLARWGWEPHLSSRWHRNHIKRFYGDYPQPSGLAGRLLSQVAADIATSDSGSLSIESDSEIGIAVPGEALYDPAVSAGSACAQLTS